MVIKRDIAKLAVPISFYQKLLVCIQGKMKEILPENEPIEVEFEDTIWEVLKPILKELEVLEEILNG